MRRKKREREAGATPPGQRARPTTPRTTAGILRGPVAQAQMPSGLRHPNQKRRFLRLRELASSGSSKMRPDRRGRSAPKQPEKYSACAEFSGSHRHHQRCIAPGRRQASQCSRNFLKPAVSTPLGAARLCKSAAGKSELLRSCSQFQQAISEEASAEPRGGGSPCRCAGSRACACARGWRAGKVRLLYAVMHSRAC